MPSTHNVANPAEMSNSEATNQQFGMPSNEDAIICSGFEEIIVQAHDKTVSFKDMHQVVLCI